MGLDQVGLGEGLGPGEGMGPDWGWGQVGPGGGGTRWGWGQVGDRTPPMDTVTQHRAFHGDTPHLTKMSQAKERLP